MQQQLPSGDEYLFVRDVDQALQTAELISKGLESVQERRRSKVLMQQLKFYKSDGQMTQLLRFDELGAFERELRERLAH
jgi:hypothetical protein